MKKFTGCLMLLSCSAPLPAIAQPFYLGEQEVSVEQAEQVQAHCEILAQEDAEDELEEMADPFEDPPDGLGDVGNNEEDEDGVGEGGTVEGFNGDDEEGEASDDGPDLDAISLEDCKAAGLVP